VNWEYKGSFAKRVSIPVAVGVIPVEQYQAPRNSTEWASPILTRSTRRALLVG